jgi:hypothetical protein
MKKTLRTMNGGQHEPLSRDEGRTATAHTCYPVSGNYDPQLMLTIATVRSRCNCRKCDRLVMESLRNFETRANTGDLYALRAALKILTAHYPANLIPFYEEFTTWRN